MTRHVVLVGPMGSGKTTVGRALARRLRLPLVDLDEGIERTAGVSIPELFAAEGEAGFRDREATALGEALDGPDAVIATGGGVVLRDANRARLRAADALVVRLVADLDVLATRVGDGSGRPLLAGDPVAALADTVTARDPLYAEVADCTIDTGAAGPAACVDTIVAARQAVDA